MGRERVEGGGHSPSGKQEPELTGAQGGGREAPEGTKL